MADRLWQHLSPSCVHRFYRSKIFWVEKSSKLVTWFLSSKSTSAISMNHLLKDICSRFRYPLWAARWWGRDHATDFLSMQKCLKVIVLRFPTLRHDTHHRNRLHPDPQTGRSGWFDGLSILSIMRGFVFIAIERFTQHFCIQEGVFGDSSSVFEALNSYALPISLHIVTESAIQQFLRILQFGDLGALSVVRVKSERRKPKNYHPKHLLTYRNVW